MRLTRRQFLELSGGAAAAFILAAVHLNRHSGGKLAFNDWRALPGMKLTLDMDIPHPETTQIHIFAKADGAERLIQSFPGASSVSIEVPAIETSEESFELFAAVIDGFSVFTSPGVEVLSAPFRFGL